MYAVIKTGGKQYKVAANDVLKIERLQGEAGGTIEFGEVLMVSDGAKTTIGTPLVAVQTDERGVHSQAAKLRRRGRRSG